MTVAIITERVTDADNPVTSAKIQSNAMAITVPAWRNLESLSGESNNSIIVAMIPT